MTCRIPGLSGLMLAGALMCASPAAFAQENSRAISTSGEAVVQVVPDEAVVTFGVETASAELESSKAANDQVARRLVASVKDMGIADRHFATDSVQVSLRYRNDDRSISAYVVTRLYMVTLKDVQQLESLVDTVLRNGANILEGVEFRTTDLRKHRDTARAMAIRAAREKALSLARELECSIGAPRAVHESGVTWYGQTRRYNYAQNAMQSVGGGGSDGSETLPLGQMAVRANVSVTFDLIPLAR
jgi:uncharacterized protein YggE